MASNDGKCEIVLCIMPEKIQKQRLRDIQTAARKRKFKTVDKYCEKVTHIVTECDSLEQVLRFLGLGDGQLDGVQVLALSWLTACLKAGRLVEVEESYRVVSRQELEVESTTARDECSPVEWACQRITCLQHDNEKLTTALEVLEKHAQLRDGKCDYSRALAFRRASCVLKSLPNTISSISQFYQRDVGDHSKRVIEEILEDGFSSEIETIIKDPWFIKMKLFSSVFGVGPSTAKKWIDRGWEKIEDAQKSDRMTSDWRVQWGLAFHDDLMSPVLRQEADNLLHVIRQEAQRMVPGALVELTGGFRRGKDSGHDADFLLTHPKEGYDRGLLVKLLQRLEDMGLVLTGNIEKSTYHHGVLKKDFKLSSRGQLDHFEKWIGIMKLPKTFKETHTDLNYSIISSHSSNEQSVDYQPASKRLKCGLTPQELSQSERDWTARRVDLIISPYSQYFYALVGWTGSKHFNRDLRLYSQRILNMKVTSHGLYDFTQNRSIPASSEKAVFDILKLPYHEPWQRNC